MNKQTLRMTMISTLKSMDLNIKKIYERAMHRQLLDSILWRKASVIGITYANEFEWNTVPLIELALQAGRTIALPKCDAKLGNMSFYSIRQLNQLKVGYAGMQEPDPIDASYIPRDSIDLLLVPGFVFDDKGFRIGFGGGYYDRFLENYYGDSVSLAAEFQLVDSVPREAFDKRVQHIITEERLITTGRNLA